jgi:hypothetical protein
MAKQTFTTGQVLTAAQMTSLQQTAMLGGAASAKTASYTLVAADAGTAISMSNAGATTITVNTGLFAAGDTVHITNLGAGVSTITAGTATVNSSASLALAQYESGFLDFTSTSAAIFVKGAGVTPSASGLTLLNKTTLSSTTNVSLNNVFSSTYDNYKILFEGSFVAGATDVEMRLRVSSSDNSSANYYAGRGTTNISGTFASAGQNGNDRWFMCSPTTASGNFTIDMFRPFAAVKTTFSGTFLSRNLDRGGYNAGFFDTTTSFDGFSIFFANACVGTLSVYGYGI